MEDELSYFICDLHLKPYQYDHDQTQKKFLQFMRQHLFQEQLSSIYIIGDFFDFWYEYDYYIPKSFFSVLCGLKELISQGKKIFYIAGNHDFYLGKFFQQEIGMRTFDDSIDCVIGANHLYIHHGDGFAKNDYGYRFLKRVLRNRLSQKLFKYVHPDLGMKIAMKTSKTSRDVNHEKDHTFDHTQYIQWAELFFKEHPELDIAIVGHTHWPLEKKIGNKLLINIGAFEKKGYYLVYKDNKFEMKQFQEEK